MKKIVTVCLLVGLTLVVSNLAAAGDMWITKIGFNTGGYLSFTPEDTLGTAFDGPLYGGCVISIEQLFELSNHLELGYGLELLFGGSENIYNYFKGTPIFVILNYHPNSIDNGGLYWLGRIGFNFYGYYDYDYYHHYYFRNPLIYGFYYALGAGFRLSEYPVIRLEVFFSSNNGSQYFQGSYGDYCAYSKYTRLTMAIGFGTGN